MMLIYCLLFLILFVYVCNTAVIPNIVMGDVNKIVNGEVLWIDWSLEYTKSQLRCGAACTARSNCTGFVYDSENRHSHYNLCYLLLNSDYQFADVKSIKYAKVI